MSVSFSQQILQGAFRAELNLAVTRAATEHRRFVRSKGEILSERFFYIEQGTFIFEDGTDLRQEFTAGDIIYLPGDVTYISRWKAEEPGRYTSINFMLYDTKGNPFSLGDSITLLLKDRHEEFYHLFREMVQAWNRGGCASTLETTSLLYRIFYHLALREEQNNRKSGRRNMDKAILFLENNYLTDITTGDLAKMAGVSECMFRRAFHQVMGVSPMQYRNRLRLTKARELLQSGEFTVLEAALLTGFDDPGYFSRLFKKEFKIRPSECLPG
jgi:AraC-like DNA-binding protein